MKVLEKNPTEKGSEIPKISDKKIHFKAKDNEKRLQKENLEKVELPKLGHKRKGPMKPLQVDSKQNQLNINHTALFESPEKEKKDGEILPVKKKIKDIVTENTTSSFIEEEHLLKVLKPEHCYQSPLQLKKAKSRTKRAANEQKKMKDVKEADHHPKKQAPRTKTDGRKQKTMEEIKKAGNEIKMLNQHFSELENMDLCIE